MKQAIELAVQRMSEGNGGPFGAVIVKDGKVIAQGYNQVTSLNDPTAHAEIQAIRAACKALGSFQLTGCEVYTSCEPCPMCLSALYWARPARIYYAATRKEAARAGFDDDFLYREVCLLPRERSIPTVQVLADEGIRPFQVWDQKPNKVRY